MSRCYCPVCDLTFSSVSSYDLHLGSIVPEKGMYEHKNPRDCGLHETARGWSLPPPMRPLTRDEWQGIFHKEES